MTITPLTPKHLLLTAAATLAVLALALAAPALSRAATYCVHDSGFTCPTGSVDDGADLTSALGQASGTPSTASAPNVITIGPGTFEPDSSGIGFDWASTYPLQIVGAGAGQTMLTDPDSGLGSAVTLSGPVDVSGLSVTGSSREGVIIDGGTLEHVAVDMSGDVLGAVEMTDAVMKDSTISLSAGTDDAISTGGAAGGIDGNEIDDVTVNGGFYGIEAEAGTTIHRTKLIGNTTSLWVDSAPVYIDDSLLAGGESGIVVEDDSNEGSVNALNDTIVAGANAATGVLSSSDTSAGADGAIYNSVVRGFPESFETSGAAATIEASSDNYDGTTDVTVSDPVQGDPKFVDPGAGGYQLAWNSPLIDAGDTGLVSADASSTDLDGNPREAPAFGGSSSPLDLGAYEYQPPTAVASATPASAPVGTAITFDGSHSSDPNDGETLLYAWTFDDGTSAVGATVTHAFSSPGTHTAKLTVIEPSGLSSSQTTTVTVTAAQAGGTTTPPGGSTNPAGGTTTAPGGSTTSPGGTTDPTLGSRLTVLGKPTVDGNKVVLRLSCAGSAACTGISVTETVRKGAVRVAFAALRLNAGQTKTITLALNGNGKTLLARSGSLAVAIKVTSSGSGKTTMIKTIQATLRAPKKPARRHA